MQLGSDEMDDPDSEGLVEKLAESIRETKFVPFEQRLLICE